MDWRSLEEESRRIHRKAQELKSLERELFSLSLTTSSVEYLANKYETFFDLSGKPEWQLSTSFLNKLSDDWHPWVSNLLATHGSLNAGIGLPFKEIVELACEEEDFPRAMALSTRRRAALLRRLTDRLGVIGGKDLCVRCWRGNLACKHSQPECPSRPGSTRTFTRPRRTETNAVRSARRRVSKMRKRAAKFGAPVVEQLYVTRNPDIKAEAA